MTIFLMIVAIVCLLIGMAGTVYPAIPALPLMYGGAWLLAYAGDYGVMASGSLIALGVVAAFGFAMDFVASLLGAKYTGASKQALWGALIGGVVGAFFGIIGVIFAPLIGAAVGEFIAKRDLLTASKVGLGTFIGFIIGTVAKIGAALAMVLIILWQYGVYWFQAA